MKTDFTADDIDQYEQKLRPNHTVILRAWLETPQYTSMANRLGIPLGTIKSRLHRARRKLAFLKEETL